MLAVKCKNRTSTEWHLSRILSRQFRDSLYQKFCISIWLLWIDFFFPMNLPKHLNTCNFFPPLRPAIRSSKSSLCSIRRSVSFCASLNLLFSGIFREKHLLVISYLPFLCHSGFERPFYCISSMYHPSSTWASACVHLEFDCGLVCGFIVMF